MKFSYEIDQYLVSKNIIKEKPFPREKMKFLSNRQQSKRDIFRNIFFAPNIFQRRTRAFETRSTTFSVFSEHVRHRNLRNLDICVSHTYRIFNLLRQKIFTSAIIISLFKVNSIVKNIGNIVDFPDVGGVIARAKRDSGIFRRETRLSRFFFSPSIPG